MKKVAALLVFLLAIGATGTFAGSLVGPGQTNASTSVGSAPTPLRNTTSTPDTAGRRKDSTVAGRTDTLAKPPIDSSDLKRLPPRALPLKEQMMFAGGFMIFVAIMLTSMQNFNPND